MNDRNAKDTKDFIDNLPEWIRNNEKEFKPYFITITFQYNSQNLPKQVYKIFFGTVFYKIDQLHLKTKSKFFDEQAWMVLEMSFMGSLQEMGLDGLPVVF